MRGGHASSGPAPDPRALARERDGSEWVVLPAQGRKGRPPAWPLTAASDRERVWWRRLWATPQATQWERQGQVVEVGLYVRRLAQAEEPDAPVTLATLVRQLADGLGLTLPGMLRLRWHLSRADVAAVSAGELEASRLDATPAARSSRDRFKVVRGGREGEDDRA